MRRVTLCEVARRRPTGQNASRREPPSQPATPPEKTKNFVMEATRATVDQHVERAKTLRDRGEHANALRNLENANDIFPSDLLISAEIEKVKRPVTRRGKFWGEAA
jgi:hypothetical protein